MINKTITNIDRGISQESVDNAWEINAFYNTASTDTTSAVYSYKKFTDTSIKYDNFYEIYQNTWQSISIRPDGRLENVVTSSLNQFNKNIILSVYSNEEHTGSGYLELFQIGYANINGSGSEYGPEIVNIYGDLENIQKQETKTLYNSIKNLFFPTGEFTLETTEIKDFLFLSVRSSFLGDGVYPGSIEFNMSKLFTDDFPIIDIEGPATPFSFIDRKINGTNIGYILSGSIQSGPFLDTFGNEFKYGYVHYPSGTIILDATKLVVYLGFTRGTTQSAPNENWKFPEQGFLSLYAAIFGNIIKYNPDSGIINTPLGSTFSIKTYNKINYTIYQCELEKSEFNYSNNITYRDTNTNTFKVKKFVSSSNYQDTLFTGSNGQILSSSNSSTYQNPEAFITTVGLYSDTYDLIAVAKLSKPIRKNYDKKIIINIRLDF